MPDPGHNDEMTARLLDAALIHIPFDGWSEATFRAACEDAGIDRAVARVLCPRGAIDLALAYHVRGDAAMLARLAASDLPTMRLRDRIVAAIRYRIEAIDDREIVRRGTALFTLPPYAGDGARAMWGTADKIWTALGDNSDDINWYSKRASLATVLSATLLFWLGDESEGSAATWSFLERRVEDVMRIEKLRAQVGGNPISKVVLAGPNWLLGQIRPPSRQADVPGRWSGEPPATGPNVRDKVEPVSGE